MRKLTALFALGAAFAMASGANAITVDGNWDDWFTYGGNQNLNNWNENAVTTLNLNTRFLNDEEGPTPGGGGQLYDIEQIFYTYQDADPNASTGGVFYIGLVTGFPPQGVPSDGLYAGDFFLDFGNTGDYTHAIAISTAAADAGRYGQMWGNTGAPNWTIIDPNPFIASTPWRLDETAAGAVDVTGLYNPSIAFGLHGVHYFYEIAFNINGFDEDILTNELSGGIGIHWTMQCGNDVIDVRDNTPFAPVPEPSTIALLGMGMVGAALRRKFTA